MINPGSACPEFFEWTTAMMVRPPTAEEIEGNAEGNAEEEAVAVAAGVIKCEAPVVEEETTDDGLQEIVGKAHLANIRQLMDDGFTHLRAIIQNRNARDIEHHHGKIAPRGDEDVEALCDGWTFYAFVNRHERLHDNKEADRTDAYLSPGFHVVALVDKQALATEDYTKDEEEERLREATMPDGPAEVHLHAILQVHEGNVKETAVGTSLKAFAKILTDADIHRHLRRIDETQDDINQFDRLAEEDECCPEEYLIGCLDQRNEEEAEDCISAEDVTIEEDKIEQTPEEEEQHTPRKTRAEIVTLLLLIVVLNVAAQAEKERKDGIHLVGTEIEDGIPETLLEGRWLREGIEIKVLKEVDQNNTDNGKAAKAIDHTDTGGACCWIHNNCNRNKKRLQRYDFSATQQKISTFF